MKAGACDACVLARSCCGSCWCCPWPTKILPPLVNLLHVRPELATRGWNGERTSLAGVLADSVVSNA